MKCLETRRRNGMKWRRYRTDKGVIVTTYEVPVSVIGQISMPKVREALERADRELARRTRNAEVKRLTREGWPTVAIAHHLGISDSQARRVRAGKV